MKKILQNIFMDWFNNFLTVECFANHYGFTEEKAMRVIALGRKVHNQKVERLHRNDTRK